MTESSPANGQNGGKKGRHRSPAYPAVSLRDAVARVAVLYSRDGKVGSPLVAALKHIGFSSAHGQALAVVSALKKYGLVEDVKGRIAPTPSAIEIIEFGPEHGRGAKALRDAALKPEIYKDLVEQFRENGRLPTDDSLKPELITDKRFNPKAVDGFLKDFRETLIYSGLTDENGVFLSGDGVENEDKDVLDRPSVQARSQRKMSSGSKEDVFTLDEGPVVLQWPERISKTSAQDLEDWLALIVRKAKRQAETDDEQDSSAN